MTDQPKTTSTLEEAAETGYLGTVPEQTPNEAATVQGQAAGQKTSDVLAAEEHAAANSPTSTPTTTGARAKPSGSDKR